MKRHEFEEVLAELEEAKNACQVALRQKKTVQTELASMTKAKNELNEKARSLETQVARKDKDLNDAMTRLTDTIADYEAKLERKDEQIWAMGSQINENQQKAVAAATAAAAQSAQQNSNQPRNHVNIDAELISDIEKKWQAKERQLVEEISQMDAVIKTKQDQIQSKKHCSSLFISL